MSKHKKFVHFQLFLFLFCTSLYGSDWLDQNEFTVEKKNNTLEIQENAQEQEKMLLDKYPNAVEMVAKNIFPVFMNEKFDSSVNAINKTGLESAGYTVKEISIRLKDSFPFSTLPYQAVIVTHPDTIHSQKWCIDASGNGIDINYILNLATKRNHMMGCNTLLIKGPFIEKNKNWPTRYRMGSGYEAGLQFLEKKTKATHIIMRGYCLGGGLISEAIMLHDFMDSIKYLYISDRTYSKLSELCNNLPALPNQQPFLNVINFALLHANMELDNVQAAKKLSNLNIPHIIIQHYGGGTDGVIPDSASLAYHLHKIHDLKEKKYLEAFVMPHNGKLPIHIEDQLNQEITQFLAE
ncbi:MAG: hypothetical protein Q8K60_06495 [Parachlamydiaceae bacterium]|nr:hypothetical protein [Parachlamydiaceae bacterium]